MKMRIVEFFSGISCQYRGFVESGCFDVEQVATSEISIDSIISNAAINHNLEEVYQSYVPTLGLAEIKAELERMNIGWDFNKNKPYNWQRASKEKCIKTYLACELTHNLGDISKVEDVPDSDLWFMSFPCTAISQAGRMKGFSPDSETNSSLLWQNIRLLKNAVDKGNSPSYIMTENVKALVSKRFIDDWNEVLDIFDGLGYNCTWKVMDAKECGLPQSRPRVFMVGIRKDIDKGNFTWPSELPLDSCIADVLEGEVDDRYLLSETIVNRFTLTDPTFTKSIIGHTMPEYRTIGQRDSVYNIDGIMGALMASDYKQPKQILIPKIRIVGSINKKVTCQAGRVVATNGIYPCITAASGGYVLPLIMDDYILRKMTPREIGRLQGFSYEDTDKMSAQGISDTKIYMAYGNGICVPCVSMIAEHLYKAQYNPLFVCRDEEIKNGETA